METKRFIYIADSHIGADPPGYQQQPSRPDRLPLIVEALRGWMAQHGTIDFVLHGGDIVDRPTPESLRAARDAFASLDVPLHLCLGNHDLWADGALPLWLAGAPGLFPSGDPVYTIPWGDAVIHVCPNHWGDTPFLWEQVQRPHFLPGQVAWLRQALAEHAGRLQILATHHPVFGIPTRQTGMPEPYHVPPEEFSRSVCEIIAAAAPVACVLGAHSHINSCVEHAGTHYVTASALVETPFEFKIFEFDGSALSMQTVSLLGRCGLDGDYDDERAWVQGEAQDRAFRSALPHSPAR